jgi:hypothetical protein
MSLADVPPQNRMNLLGRRCGRCRERVVSGIEPPCNCPRRSVALAGVMRALDRDVAITDNCFENLSLLAPEELTKAIADPSDWIAEVRILGWVEQIGECLPGGGGGGEVTYYLSLAGGTSHAQLSMTQMSGNLGEVRGCTPPSFRSSEQPYLHGCLHEHFVALPMGHPVWVAEREGFGIGRSSKQYGPIGHTSHFLRLGGWGYPALKAAVATGSELATNSLTVAAFASAATEFAQRYRRLNEAEKTVIDVLRKLAQGGSIYKVWINEDELLGAMAPELDGDARRRLLANMKSRRILEEGAGKWRVVF